MRARKYFIFTLVVILADQAIKLLVHFNMDMGSEGEIIVFDDWFKLHYILNRGMAFGLIFGSIYGKLGLTFRLVAAAFIGVVIYRFSNKTYHPGLLWCMAAIFGGGISNIIDSIFYGVFLDNAPFNAITPWFHGQVIDMFYIDLRGRLPARLDSVVGRKYDDPFANIQFGRCSYFFRSFCSIIFSKDLFGYEQTPQK